MISVLVFGNEFSLDDGTICYFIGDDGLGMLPIHRLTERGPMQNGDTDVDYRYDPRIFKLLLEIVAQSWLDLFARRQSLLRLFKPRIEPVSVKVSLSDILQIDAHYVSDLSLPSSDIDGFSQKVVITLRAADPTFYDPAGNSITFQLGAGADSFPVPMSVPHNVGASTIDLSTAITYDGTADSFPNLIRITGPITNPIITNLETGEKLDFTGTTISGGDYYDLDLRYGYKTVKDSTGANKISKLTSNSDLATWHLVSADDGSSSRENTVRVQGTGATTTTKVEISFYSRFVGL